MQRLFGIISKKDNLNELINKVETTFKQNNLEINRKLLREKNLFLEAGLIINPQSFSSSKTFITIDGIIENIGDLKKEFNLSGNNEAALIEELYLSKSVPNLEVLLLGSFVISIFDKRSNILFVIRDHFGTKPLFYYNDANCFVYSSEIKYIKAIKQISLNPDLNRVKHYLCQSKPNNTDTFFEEVKSLQPSSVLSFSNNHYMISKFVHYKNYRFAGHTMAEAKSSLKNAILESCKRKIQIDNNYGIQFSGGLDSSVIYKALEQISDTVPKSFSLSFKKNDKEMVCDEKFYQELIHKNNMLHTDITCGNISPYKNISTYLDRIDQPFDLANAYLYEAMYKSAKAKNLSSLFDGVDGDLVVSHGWERFKELFNFIDFFKLIKELHLFEKKHDYSQYKGSGLFRMFLVGLFRQNKYFKLLFLAYDKAKNQIFPNFQRTRTYIVKKEILKDLNLTKPYNFDNNFKTHKEKFENKYIESAFIDPNILFFNYGVKQFSPFFDKKVVDLCVSFPSKMKLNNGESRYILREAFKDMLPIEITERFSKSNLTHNFIAAVNEYDVKKIEGEIHSIHHSLKNIIDKDALKADFEKLKSGDISEKNSMNIWSFYIANKWFKKNF